MNRQLNFTNFSNSPFNNLTTPQGNRFPTQVMSCPDLDSADNQFGDINGHYQPLFTPYSFEVNDGYMVSYDIYGRAILGNPIEERINARQTADNSQPWDFEGGHMMEEEDDIMGEYAPEKENMNPAENFVQRQRAQSDCFGTIRIGSLQRNGRREILKDITPTSEKKEQPSSSSENNVRFFV